MTTGIVILTLNAARDLTLLLPLLLQERGVAKILVMDSESSDETASVVRAHPGVDFVSISRAMFNHGATREAARRLVDTDIVVFLTQDVVPCPGWLESLVTPIRDSQVAVSYARQLPHPGADIFEAFPREFNYPLVSHRRSLADAEIHGVYTFFCSDSCAAYLNRALDDIGGFEATLTNEDYFAVARLLKAGQKIAYVADAAVYHSHRYSIRQEFERYFDNGYVRAENRWVTDIVGHAEKRGSSMAVRFLKQLCRHAPWLLPYAVIHMGAKWLGFRAGYFGYRWPKRWCRQLSSQKYYWNSVYCRHPRG